MKLAMAAFGVATLVGVGYVIGKKVVAKRKDEDFFDLDDFDSEFEGDESDVGAYAKSSEKDSYGRKIHKASMFAVGAIKTSADKLGETISDIKSKDMVEKGKQTFSAVKETGGNIKNDIKREVEDLKCMVSSINDDVAEGADDIADAAQDVVEDVVDATKNIFSTDISDSSSEN
jgi:gas vesicle protein